MPYLKPLVRYVLVPVFLLFVSCVKDVDLKQANEIVIPPTVAVDLVYFTLHSNQFYPANTAGPRMAEDVVRLEFLDDDYIQDGLVRAELNYSFTNTFTNPIQAEIVFLSENNSERYRTSLLIPGGSPEDPGVVDFTEVLEGQDLAAFKKAIKMRMDLEMFSGAGTEEGQLQLKSSAILKLEF